jgi:ABC-type Mn2+/Zn2+ transport system permease subunit
VTAIAVYLSYAFDLPTGATIVTCLGAALVLLGSIGRLVGVRSA